MITIQTLYDAIFNHRIVYYYRKWEDNPQIFDTYQDYTYDEL